MCWIAWAFLKENTLVESQRLINACDTMKHRGPDASWIRSSVKKDVGLAHVRLAIVDLNPRSNQPFVIDNEKYTLIFNGEIYNYKSLRVLLQKQWVEFTTNSDTEVLIYLYKIYGETCVSLIEWMFAFAIYEAEAELLFLARDSTWQKPLLYTQNEQWFFFASEIPALQTLLPRKETAINYWAISLFLLENYSHIPHPRTIFENIRKLEPWCTMIIRNGAIHKKSRYYVLKKKSVLSDPDSLKDLLYEKLESMKPKEVSYASFLSGGLDSSFVVAGLGHNEKTTETYTFAHTETDEDSVRASLVAEHLGCVQHIIYPSTHSYLTDITDTVSILGEPYFHVTSLFADQILRKAKNHHKVFFTGAWWDELFYGYNNVTLYWMTVRFKLFERGVGKSVYTPQWKHFLDPLVGWLQGFKKNLYAHSFQRLSTTLHSNLLDRDAFWKAADSVIQSFNEAVDYNSFIDFSYMFGFFIENQHSLTIQSDVIGMKHSIEIRSLFLEKELLDYAYSLELKEKIWSMWLGGKQICKKNFKHILPKSILEARKIWFWSHFNFKQFFQQNYMQEITVTLYGLIERIGIEKAELDWLLFNFESNFHLIMKLFSLQKRYEEFM